MALRHGNQPNVTFGRRGRLGTLAAEALEPCLTRLAAILAAAGASSAAVTCDAAELVLRHRGPDLKADAIAALRQLVEDPRTPDAAGVRAAQILMARAQGELQ